MLGNSELSDETLDIINDEKAKHKDILALPMIDSYQTLTSKLLASFVQLSRNVKFEYLLKVDDDSYVQLPMILEELKNSNFDKSFLYYSPSTLPAVTYCKIRPLPVIMPDGKQIVSLLDNLYFNHNPHIHESPKNW